MEYLTLGEKTFVKANKIAKDLGYTADYIGQLCRSGKVEAKLVGRTWYVEESSIRDHKRSRYRSVRSVAKRELRKEAVANASGELPVAIRTISTSAQTAATPAYSKHKHSTLVTPQYVHDDADLMPQVVKGEDTAPERRYISHSLPIKLADAEQVSITSERQTTSFEPTELPEIRFRGKLSVASADEAESEYEDPNKTEDAPVPVEEDPATEPVNDAPSADAVSIDVVDEDRKRPYKVEIETAKKTTPAVSRAREADVAHIPVVETVGSVDTVVPVEEEGAPAKEEEEYPEARIGWGVLVSTLLLSSMLAVVALSVEHQITVDDVSLTNGYVLDIESTLSELYAYIKGYLG